MPLAAGLVGIIPALAQLSPKLDGSEPIILSPLSLIGWCLAIAFFGSITSPLCFPLQVNRTMLNPSLSTRIDITSQQSLPGHSFEKASHCERTTRLSIRNRNCSNSIGSARPASTKSFHPHWTARTILGSWPAHLRIHSTTWRYRR